MKPQTASESQIADMMIVEATALFNRMEEIRQEIARRAYELFEERGREPGHEQQDWLLAESKLLIPLSIEMVETSKQLRVTAEVADFTEKDIQVSVEPRRLLIGGKKTQSTEPDGEGAEPSEYSSMMFFRALDLPATVDTKNVKASLKDGVLKVTLQKAAETEGPEAEPRE